MITAKQITDWASTTAGQRELPRLIRRLIHASATIELLAMPAGDSTSRPGWDGELNCSEGNAWVPEGRSFWEIGCESGPTTKANSDYTKRTEAIDHAVAGKSVYIALSGRKWSTKKRWEDSKKSEAIWKDVRAYDCDDIEDWLEQNFAVQLAFAEELGLSGSGIKSLQRYFSDWGAQSDPVISRDAILAGRIEPAQKFREQVAKAANSSFSPIPIKADSTEEAVAFVAAALSDDLALIGKAVVVSEASSWRFVDQNESIRIAVAVSPEVAEAPSSRDKLAVVVPYASGDIGAQFKGIAGKIDSDDAHTRIQLPRPDHQEFEEALVALGCDTSDARRLSSQCGRSWSVFRRQHNRNPAIVRPKWLDHTSARVLTTLCLLGWWSTGKADDTQIVEVISGQLYSKFESELIELERLEDSPVVRIGKIWKAKAPLELLALYADRISQDEIDRFFHEAENILSSPDPKLELPEEERYAASIHGKVRPVSNYLIRSLCDTLIKLSVRGEEVSALAEQHIGVRVDALVRKLLHDADTTRWLSLESHLPALAEASPDVFLEALESDLQTDDPQVLALLRETKSAGVFGGCWHAGLLWALECLAWAPSRLVRVAAVLAKMTETPIAGNWVNTPANSLLSIFRTWYPQTAATAEQRIAALQKLARDEPAAAFRLLDELTNIGHDTASPNAKPRWRDDDAGAGNGTTHKERHDVLIAAADLYLDVAKGNSAEVAALVRKYDDFDEPRRRRVIDLASDFLEDEDEHKEVLRRAARRRINWQRNFGDLPKSELDTLLAPLEDIYRKLEPNDLIVRYAWLFMDHFPDLPMKTREEDHRFHSSLVEEKRAAALSEIFGGHGWSGVKALAERSKEGWRVGWALSGIDVHKDEIVRWIAQDVGELDRQNCETHLVAGAIGRFAATDPKFGTAILTAATAADRDQKWKVRLLTLLREEPSTWVLVESLGTDAEELYWKTCDANIFLDGDIVQKEYALRKLLAAQRPVSALSTCHFTHEEIDADIIYEMLSGILSGQELIPGGIREYQMQQAIDRLEGSNVIDRIKLAQLEFALIKALGFEGEQTAATLYDQLTSNPQIFVELLCLAYRPKGAEPRELTDGEQAAADNAWHVLHACKRQPGTGHNGSVDAERFHKFVADARKLAAAEQRLGVCDGTLGGIFAHAPVGEDGIFPFEPARDVMEEVATKELFSGFRAGCYNKRGVTTRDPFSGGGLERDLAEQYRAYSKSLEISHPRLAAVLEQLASSYDHEGHLEDLDAELRREQH